MLKQPLGISSKANGGGETGNGRFASEETKWGEEKVMGGGEEGKAKGEKAF